MRARGWTSRVPSVGALCALSLGGGERGFPAFVWRDPRTEPAASARVVSSFGAAVLARGEAPGVLGARGLELLLFNAAGRDELHLERGRPGYLERWQRWYDTRDDALLVRQPCLSDPATLARLERTLEESLRAVHGVPLSGLSLGDEVGLTPHGAPEDVCLSPTCRQAWRRYLAESPEVSPEERARFDDLSRFSTDVTRLALVDGATEALRPWLLRRRFHESAVRGVLERLRERAKQIEPAIPVGLLGLGAQSPFGTPRVELVLRSLDFAETYREADAAALLETLLAPGQRALATVFCEPGESDLAAHQVWEHWLRGGAGVVMWSDATLARDEELLERCARAVHGVRGALAAAPELRSEPAGAAVVHDFDSLCASWILDALLDGPTWPRRFASHQLATGTWERGVSGWLALFGDCRLRPGALPLDEVSAETRARFGLLVLSEVAVLDEEDLEHLDDYVKAGGSLLVSGRFGWVDSRGKKPERDPYERLAEVSGERVARLEGAGDYPFERSRRTARARAWREAARGWIDSAGVRVAPWRIEPAAEDLPWLCAWSSDAGGVISAAALPNWIGVQGSGGLSDLALEIVPDSGFTLEWLLPEERVEGAGESARLLRAGDAALFRLVPAAK